MEENSKKSSFLDSIDVAFNLIEFKLCLFADAVFLPAFLNGAVRMLFDCITIH